MTTNADRDRVRIDWSDLSLHWWHDWSTWVFGIRVDWHMWLRYFVIECGPFGVSLEVGEDFVDD